MLNIRELWSIDNVMIYRLSGAVVGISGIDNGIRNGISKF